MTISGRRFYLLISLFGILTLSTLTLFTIAPVPTVRAQSCDNIPQGSGQSMSATATIDGTTNQLTTGGFVPAGTSVRLDSRATADGQCIGMVWNCQTSPCVCQQSGYTYERTINHTNVYVDITSSGVWNGTYFVGTVQFLNNYGHVQDSQSADTTGPLHFGLAIPGTYTFRFKAVINTTPCNIQPGETDEVSITINAGASDDAPNAGTTECQTNVG